MTKQTTVMLLSAFSFLTLNTANANVLHSISIVKQQLKPYVVKFRVGNTNSQRTLHLHSASETEAIAQLKKQNSVPKDATVIILSIKSA